MGPEEPRDPYSGSGEAAGAPGHTGNVHAVCLFVNNNRTGSDGA